MEDRDHPGNIQNDFFKHARKDRARLTVFLNSGKKLIGKIKGYDRFTIVLDGPGGEQMVFKHAIATITSAKTFGNFIDFDGRQPDRDRKPSSPRENPTLPDSPAKPVSAKKPEPSA